MSDLKEIIGLLPKLRKGRELTFQYDKSAGGTWYAGYPNLRGDFSIDLYSRDTDIEGAALNLLSQIDKERGKMSNSTTPNTKQADLAAYISDPETIKRAAEGSMQKRQDLVDKQEMREKIEYMFASAWQDGVDRLNPKYLRRDKLFTDKTMQLIADTVEVEVNKAVGELKDKSVDSAARLDHPGHMKDSQDTTKVTRFEVIDHTTGGEGRAYVKHDVSVELSYQDDGRTLKVFVEDQKVGDA